MTMRSNKQGTVGSNSVNRSANTQFGKCLLTHGLTAIGMWMNERDEFS